MRKHFFLLPTALFLSSCMFIFPYNTKFYSKLSREEQMKYKLFPLDSANQNNNEILSINSQNFLSLINQDTINFKLLVFFTYWCPSSRAFLPNFVKQTNPDNLKVFYISPDDWVFKPSYLSYKTLLKLKSNIYLLDVNRYGRKKNPHYRMKKFIAEICNNCDDIKGFPSFILFDKTNHILYKGTGAVTIDSLSKLM